MSQTTKENFKFIIVESFLHFCFHQCCSTYRFFFILLLDFHLCFFTSIVEYLGIFKCRSKVCVKQSILLWGTSIPDSRIKVHILLIVQFTDCCYSLNQIWNLKSGSVIHVKQRPHLSKKNKSFPSNLVSNFQTDLLISSGLSPSSHGKHSQSDPHCICSVAILWLSVLLVQSTDKEWLTNWYSWYLIQLQSYKMH